MNTISQWQQDGAYFDDNGHALFYRSGGAADAPALFLIHGFPTASLDWAPLWQTLCQHFQVWTIDMLGFGLSEKPKRHPYSVIDQANRIRRFLAAQGISQIHLFAHDYGNSVAQELLAQQQEGQGLTIQSLLLLNGGLFPETHQPVLLQKLLISPLGGLVARLSSYRKFKQNFDHICAKPLAESDLQAYWELLQRDNGLAVMPKLIRYMAERKTQRSRWVGALQQFNGPLRLIDGLDDPVSGAHMVQRYRELIPQPDVVELTGVGHYPQVEAPDQVLSGALAFWRAHSII